MYGELQAYTASNAAIIALSSNLYLKNSGLLKIETLEKLHVTVAWIGSLVPVLFILNFPEESERISNENQNNPQKLVFKNWLNILILVCIGLMVGQGYDLFVVLGRDEQKEISPICFTGRQAIFGKDLFK